MGLLALCLLPLLSPQEPTPGPQPTSPPPAVAEQPSDAQELCAAERAGDTADATVLVHLTKSTEAGIAARAAWLLSRSKDAQRTDRWVEVLATSPDADARAQMMQSMFRNGDATSTDAAIKALGDADRRVRTLAAQALGKWRRPTSVQPLLGLLDDHRNDSGTEAKTDLQAALLALHDLGAAEHLMRAATALNDGTVTGVGEALAYWLQDLSPTLSPDQELPLLLATLSHRELLVRRYAITRLAQFDQPGAVKALEGRLAKEGNELRPLLQVALAQLRRDREPPPPDEVGRVRKNYDALVARAEAKWREMPNERRAIVIAIPAVLLLSMWLLLRRHRRQVRLANAAATAALAQPSEQYLDELAAEAVIAEVEAAEAATMADAEAEPTDDATAEFAAIEPHAVDTGEWAEAGTDELPVGAEADWQHDESHG